MPEKELTLHMNIRILMWIATKTHRAKFSNQLNYEYFPGA